MVHFDKAFNSELSLQLLYYASDIHMNCPYFAMERRRTFKVNKKIKKKQKQKNNKQADKPKQNETEIYKRASEEYITHAQ